MRISQNLIANLSRQHTARASSALLAAQRPLLEGTSLPKPSTDMAAADRALLLDRFDRALARHDQARATVRTDLASAEIALSGIHDLVVDAQDLALRMGSDTVGNAERADGARVARALLDQIAGLANGIDVGGKYHFTGLAEGLPPLTTPDMRYQGNDGVRMVEVAPGVRIAATVSGEDVFGPNDELVTVLEGLVSALEAGDATAIRDALDGISAARERVSSTLTDVGGRLKTLDDLGDHALSLRTSVQIEHGALTAVDVAQVAPAVTSAQTMLEAVLVTSQRLMQQIGSAWLR